MVTTCNTVLAESSDQQQLLLYVTFIVGSDVQSSKRSIEWLT